MKKFLSIVLVVVLSFALVVFVGCKKGDAEKKDVAENIEEVADDAANAAEEGAEALQEAVQ